MKNDLSGEMHPNVSNQKESDEQGKQLLLAASIFPSRAEINSLQQLARNKTIKNVAINPNNLLDDSCKNIARFSRVVS